MLRKGRYKYHYYVSYPLEQLDLAVGPVELHDLAPDPAHREILDKMEALLRARIDPKDVGRQAKEAQAALIERHGGHYKARNAGAPDTTPVLGYAKA